MKVEIAICLRMKMKLQVGLVMKVEIVSMLNYKNRNCKFAQL